MSPHPTPLPGTEHAQQGRCRNPEVSLSPSIYLHNKLVFFPELLWSLLTDGLFDRAWRAVGVGVSADGGLVFLGEEEHGAAAHWDRSAWSL